MSDENEKIIDDLYENTKACQRIAKDPRTEIRHIVSAYIELSYTAENVGYILFLRASSAISQIIMMGISACELNEPAGMPPGSAEQFLTGVNGYNGSLWSGESPVHANLICELSELLMERLAKGEPLRPIPVLPEHAVSYFGHRL